MVKPAFEAVSLCCLPWRQPQREFNVGKAVPGRRKCSEFFIPLLTANAVALSNREVTAYDTNNYLMPSERRAYRSARSGSDRAEWDDAALTTAKMIVVNYVYAE